MRHYLTVSLSSGALLMIFVGNAYAINCTVPAPRVGFAAGNRQPFGGPIMHSQVFWYYDGRADCRDIYNVRVEVIGGNVSQTEVQGIPCPVLGCAFNVDANRDKPYVFSVQACHTAFLQSSSCSVWGAVYYLRYGPDTCREGFVWRELVPNDHVCVSPQTRQQGITDNALAAQRRNPAGGPYGPDTCLSGFVWREVTPNDHVCVPPPTRDQTRADNTLAAGRRARN